MKYCKNCGSENIDANKFCFNCRCDSFSDTPAVSAPAVSAPAASAPAASVPPAPPQIPAPPPQRPLPPLVKPKKPLGISDMFSILGLVASIVGMFCVSIILHPLAAIASIVAFIMGTKFKALAIAGFVISIVGGIVFTVISLHQNGYIPEWLIYGAFH